MAPVLGLLLTSALFGGALATFRGDDPVLGEWRNRAAQLKTAHRQESVRVALEVYRVKTGSYPPDLAVLLGESLVPESVLYNDERERWAYTLSPSNDSFALLAKSQPAR